MPGLNAPGFATLDAAGNVTLNGRPPATSLRNAASSAPGLDTFSSRLATYGRPSSVTVSPLSRWKSIVSPMSISRPLSAESNEPMKNTRRNSPSESTSTPAPIWRSTASRMQSSSISLSAAWSASRKATLTSLAESRSREKLECCSSASSRRAGRSRLPTCSPRKPVRSLALLPVVAEVSHPDAVELEDEDRVGPALGAGDRIVLRCHPHHLAHRGLVGAGHRAYHRRVAADGLDAVVVHVLVGDEQ